MLQKANVSVCLCFFFVIHDFKTPWIRACLELETIRSAFLALILLGLFEGRANPHLFAGKLLKATIAATSLR